MPRPGCVADPESAAVGSRTEYAFAAPPEIPLAIVVFAVCRAWILFGDRPLKYQRGFRNAPMPVAEGQFKTLDQEGELFDLVNFGGVTQGEVDDDLTGGPDPLRHEVFRVRC